MYGQDVAIANKMESEGIPDKIQVSKETKLLLEDNPNHKYTFVRRDEIVDPDTGENMSRYIHIKALDKDVEGYFLDIRKEE